MLVNITNMVINTQNITLITEEHGYAVLHFVGNYPKSVTLSVSLNEFIKYLEDVGVTTHG